MYQMLGSDSYPSGKTVIYFAADSIEYKLVIQSYFTCFHWGLHWDAANGSRMNITSTSETDPRGPRWDDGLSLALHVMEMVSDGAIGELAKDGVQL